MGLDGDDRHAAPARQSRMVPAKRPHYAPTTGSESEPVQPDAMRLLTPDEQMALGLVTSDDPMPASGLLLLAATGLAKLASAHLGRRLVQDDDGSELSRRDRIALALAPRLGAEVRQEIPKEHMPDGAHDPIVALLESPGLADGGDVVVTTRLDLGRSDNGAAEDH